MITRVAIYVGTMTGPDGYLHRWTAPRNKFVKTWRKINDFFKSLVERLVTFKIDALSVLGLVGSIAAPDEASLKNESHALQSLHDSELGLGIDVHWIHIISLSM